MSASNGANGGNRGTVRPTVDTIDYVYDQSTEGNVVAHDTIRGSDYTDIVGDDETESDEILEVFRVEMIPPTSGGELQSIDALRLWDGDNYYPHIRYREFMLAYQGPDMHLTTPDLGTPALAGATDPTTGDTISPAGHIFETSVPKYGPTTTVSPALINDGNAITDSFRVRLWVIRWDGTDEELTDYIEKTYGRTTFQQDIGMSNPYKGTGRQYTRANPVRIEPGAEGGAKGQFTKLAGGIDQELPKVFPWVTWSANNDPTQANKEYKFRTRNSKVVEDYQELEFDFTDRKNAAIFQYLQVNEPDHLHEGLLVLESRPDPQPNFQLSPNAAHQLPLLRPTDGYVSERDDLPVDLSEDYEVQVVWDDGGGFRVVDDGTPISADDVLVGVQGRRLELTS